MAAPQTVQIKIQVDSKTGQISLKTMEKGFEKITLTAKQAEQAAKQLNTTVSQLTANNSITATANSYTKLGVSMSGTAAASGTATASVLELGRAISDAPYGIRGVANNLSQLASMFALSARNAGGFTGALKGMFQVLKGPLGILLAIQTGIALLDAFAGSTKKAKEENKDLAESISKSTSELFILRKAMDDENVSQSQRIELVRDANEKYKDLNVQISENGTLTDESVSAIDRKIFALTRLAKANAIQIQIEKEMTKTIDADLKRDSAIQKAGFKNQEKAQVFIDKYIQSIEDKNMLLKDAMSMEQFGKEDTYDGSASKKIFNMIKLIKEAGEEAIASQEQIDILIKMSTMGDEAIRDIIDTKDKKGRGGRAKAQSLLKQQMLDLEKFILNSNRKNALILEENEREQLNIKQKYDKEDLLLRKTSFIEKQKQRLADFLAVKRTAAEKAQANATFKASEIQAEAEHQEALTALTTLHTTQRQRFQLELMRQFNSEMIDNRLQMMSDNESMLAAFTDGTSAGMLNKPQSLVGAEDIERQQEAALARREAEQVNFEADLVVKQENLLNEGYTLLQTEQLIEADRNEWLMEQMQFELQIERDKIEAKRNINLEYISWVGGLGSIMQGFAKENKAMAMAALVLQKGAAIASVVVNTQAANASIMAATNESSQKAIAHGLASSFQGAAMTAAGNPAGIALAAAGKAEIASGATIQAGGAARVIKNKIGAGISIAAIAASAIGQASMGGSSGGGGGGGGGAAPRGGTSAPSREFDFNLVGSTGVNQLAQGVGANFNEPVQAYVVSSQMTSQQQLDNVIQTTASLGD